MVASNDWYIVLDSFKLIDETIVPKDNQILVNFEHLPMSEE